MIVVDDFESGDAGHTSSFDDWIDRQHRHAARMMMCSVSQVGVVKTRPGFAQEIRPKRGSIVASPVLADWDPEPDYFYHWFRDSAIVVDALRRLYEAGYLRAEAVMTLADFVAFSAGLAELDGRKLIEAPGWRGRVSPASAGFLRSDEDLALVHGERVLSDTRVNPDGTLDVTTWGRPQNDGPALRALALLRWARCGARLDAPLSAALALLLRTDLAFVSRHWRQPCLDLWEEESALHYFTLRVQAAALEEGADWSHAAGDAGLAAGLRDEAKEILLLLDAFRLKELGSYRSRLYVSGGVSPGTADVAIIIATNQAEGRGARHSVRDGNVHRTLAQLEGGFEAEYVVNHARPAGRAPALGRYPGDAYQGGNPWYVTTLAAAEFCYRAAAGSGDAALWARGDAFLATVRAHTPPSGDMSEQFDRVTGEPRSARHLAWSYAAFISCVAARRARLL